MKKLLTLTAAALVLTACSSKKTEAPTEEAPAKKYLVLYYSQTGATKTVAEEFQKALGADIEAITLTNEYPTDYQETLNRAREEMEKGEYPEVNQIKANLDDYDVIFFGYPIWFGTYATPVVSALQNINFAGKQVVNFCTFGSGGLLASTNDLKKAKEGINVLASYGVRNARVGVAPAEVKEFLTRNGFLEGEVEPLGEFSEQQPVTAEGTAIFDKAVFGYPMLNAKATTAGHRAIVGGTEYLFHADNQGAGGAVGDIQVWVTVKDGAEPEFTLVER